MKARLILPVIAALLAYLPGCGGGASTSSDPVSLAPPGSLVFLEGTLRPSGELKSNVDAIARKVAGIPNLGDFIVSKLERSEREKGEPFDFAKEVDPWLGEKAGVFLNRFEGGHLSVGGLVLQTTDPAASQKFINHQAEISKHRIGGASYQGIDYKIDYEDHNAVGVVGDFVVSGEADSTASAERAFKEAVDASKGESLADEERYQGVASAAPSSSLADAYVDVGGLLRESGEDITPGALQLFQSAGIEPSKATVFASLVPESDQLAIDLASELGGQRPPTGDASELLGSLPGESFAALAISGFGEQLKEAIDRLDAAGIPGQVPPHELKSGLKEAGIDLESIVGSLRDVGIFAVGSGKSTLGGAAVFTTANASRARNTVSNIGFLLRASHTPGVTAVTGKASGFSVRSPQLGRKPVVVVAKGDRIAVGYGLPETLQGVSGTAGESLSGNPDYQAAVSSLGDTPIGGFVDGPGALRLVEALISPSEEEGFQEAKPYLTKIRFLALGWESEGELTKAKLIVGLSK